MHCRRQPISPIQVRGNTAPSAAFTLIELILVMTMLVIVLSVTGPSLSRFFRGRTLDSEAKRFLALTRFGQNRAVSEGVPILLWMDMNQGAYGLQADSSYVEQDTRMLEYRVSPDVKMEVEQTRLPSRQTTVWRGNGGVPANMARIKFTPDGFISLTSPERVLFRGNDEGQILIGQSFNRLQYEIQTNQNQRYFR